MHLASLQNGVYEMDWMEGAFSLQFDVLSFKTSFAMSAFYLLSFGVNILQLCPFSTILVVIQRSDQNIIMPLLVPTIEPFTVIIGLLMMHDFVNQMFHSDELIKKYNLGLSETYLPSTLSEMYGVSNILYKLVAYTPSVPNYKTFWLFQIYCFYYVSTHSVYLNAQKKFCIQKS